MLVMRKYLASDRSADQADTGTTSAADQSANQGTGPGPDQSIK
jgi:hypothetical protein